MSDENARTPEMILPGGDNSSPRGKLYWFLRHVREYLAHAVRHHWLICTISVLVLIFLMVGTRAFYHHAFLQLWKMSFLILVCVVFGALLKWVHLVHRFIHFSWKKKIAVGIPLAALVCSVVFWGYDSYWYVALWYRYTTLKIVDVDLLPLTDFDRALPRQVIVTSIKQTMHDSSVQTSIPSHVRLKENLYGWSYAILPGDRLGLRLAGNIRKVGFLPSHSQKLNIETATEDVCFSTAENLLFGKNTRTATIWSFSPWRFFRYEPEQIFFVKDDSGKWVQVVSLKKWKAFPFPVAVFGGVQVIPQDCHGFLYDAMRVFKGAGYFIPAEEVHKHKFLHGQNTLADSISVHIGESFRFQNGFTVPMLTHRGDIRFPVFPDDLNQMPYTMFFRFDNVAIEDKLIDFIAFEPYNRDLHGYNTSLYIPSDGTPIVYRYRHADKGEAYVGYSAISGYVQQSRPTNDWTSTTRAVEHRPYHKKFNGKHIPFTLTTVVVIDPKDKGKMTASGKPYSVITYPIVEGYSIWLESDMSHWDEEIALKFKDLLPVPAVLPPTEQE